MSYKSRFCLLMLLLVLSDLYSQENDSFRTLKLRGRVIDESTEKPMAGVYILVNSGNFGLRNVTSITAQEWTNLQSAAIKTDVDGFFTAISTVTKLNRYTSITALKPGYAISSMFISPDANISEGESRTTGTGRQTARLVQPGANGFTEIPAINMTPQNKVYFPEFVFEDENGRITDPKKLNSIKVIVKGYGGNTPLNMFLERGVLEPTTYSAEATWDGKYHFFKPVDLTTARPAAVVFKSGGGQSTHITCTSKAK